MVILEHAPRHDIPSVDPTGLKPKLAEFANSTFAYLWHSSAMKDKIVIGKHSLDCAGDMVQAWFKDDWSGRYDGVHMYGRQGQTAYTQSLLKIFKSVIPTQQFKNPSSSSSHTDCPQAVYQKKSGNKISGKKMSKTTYNVLTSNKFNVLGN